MNRRWHPSSALGDSMHACMRAAVAAVCGLQKSSQERDCDEPLGKVAYRHDEDHRMQRSGRSGRKSWRAAPGWVAVAESTSLILSVVSESHYIHHF